MIDCASRFGACTETVCEVFSAGRGPVYDYLRFNAQSPQQVPFYYLKLVRDGKTERRPGRATRLSTEQVGIAYQAVFQHDPSPDLVSTLHETCGDHRKLTHELLASPRFIERLPSLLAQAFPDLRRLWHVHIPKTAGTSFFAAATASGWGYVNYNRLLAAAGDVQKVAESLRIGPEIRSRLIISGHWHLWRQLSDIDPVDPVVIFVRDPLEAMISEFNFAVDVVNGSDNVHAASPSVMLDRGFDPASFPNSYRQGFFVANVQCSYLAHDSLCQTVLANLARLNAELLPSSAVDYATRKYFATIGRRRENVSRKHIELHDLAPSLREELLLRSTQDVMLNEIARRRFQELS